MLDPDGLLFGHNDGLRLLNNTGDRANLTGLIWYGYDEKWSPSIVCLPNTGMYSRFRFNQLSKFFLIDLT